jgi:uncharacterized membrane protein YcaP (DUF421 family)
MSTQFIFILVTLVVAFVCGLIQGRPPLARMTLADFVLLIGAMAVMFTELDDSMARHITEACTR